MVESNYTLWFTGRHGSGKSTIARRLVEVLNEKGVANVILDGGEIRKNVSPDLGYTAEERAEQMRRVAGICNLISMSGVLAVAAVASLKEEQRKFARDKLGDNMLLVYLDCSLDVCQERDVKGHYKKGEEKAKNYENFKVSFDFEEPKDADIVLNTDKESVEESVEKLLKFIEEKGALK